MSLGEWVQKAENDARAQRMDAQGLCIGSDARWPDTVAPPTTERVSCPSCGGSVYLVFSTEWKEAFYAIHTPGAGLREGEARIAADAYHGRRLLEAESN